MRKYFTRKRVFSNKSIAFLVSFIMLAALFCMHLGNVKLSKIRALAEGESDATTFMLNANDLEIGDITSTTLVGENNFFKVYPATSGTAVSVEAPNNHNKSLDGYNFTKRLKLGGTGNEGMRSISFDAGSSGTVTIYALSSSGTADRDMIIEAKTAGTKEEFKVLGSPIGADLSKVIYALSEADTYTIYSKASGLNIYGVIVSAEQKEVDRKDWSQVADPTLGAIVQDGAKIKVPFTMAMGDDGADTVKIDMLDSTGANIIDSKSTSDTAANSVEFTPTASGNYKFKITATRNVAEGETELSPKVSTISSEVAFDLPLVAPAVRARTGANDSLIITVSSVNEATKYMASYKLANSSDSFTDLAIQDADASKTEYAFNTTALTVGEEYKITATAYKGSESKTSSQVTVKLQDNQEFDWSFAASGPSASSSGNKYTGNAVDGINLVSSAGKIQDGGSEGYGFYYTKISKDNNFELSAKITMNSWTYDNAQEGFMVLARDSEPIHGNTDNTGNYTNSYGYIASKVEYYYNYDDGKVSNDSDAGASKTSMKIGSGARSVTGNKTWSNSDSNKSVTVIKTLETSLATSSGGTYSLFGNYTNDGSDGKDPSHLRYGEVTEVTITLKKTNTAFYVEYSDNNGSKGSDVFYDMDDLYVMDKDYIYVGFGAARHVDISVNDIKLKISDAKTDPAKEERPIEKVDVRNKVNSSSTSGLANYNFSFTPNYNGKLTVKVGDNKIIDNVDIYVDKAYTKQVTLSNEITEFKISAKPNDDYKPSEFEIMSNYAEVAISFMVTYKKIGSDNAIIYIGKDGGQYGNGTKENPFDIYTGLKYARPGQTFVLLGGKHYLSTKLTIPRGIDGTAEAPITVVGDPNRTEDVVLDFGGVGGGMQHWGNYWVFRDFDLTGSKGGEKGIQLSGSYNKFIQVNTYNNGNTGLQISGISKEPFEMWPAYNQIINCTSYNNHDLGHTDADGFASKLTSGVGNVFDGCIAYDNADDGWDLFAKVVTGPIGYVTIKNCVSYNNGYFKNGSSGNGFKLGGTSLAPVDENGDPAQHKLINSIAYGNSLKGIDSNSNPNVYVENCISYNNDKYNIAFYSGASPTKFTANGIISIKDSKTHVDNLGKVQINENFSTSGQSDSDYKNKNNFYTTEDKTAVLEDGSYSYVSKNSDGVTLDNTCFISTDVENISPTRHANGSINMNGLLELTTEAKAIIAAAGTNAGAEFKEDTTVTPDFTLNGEEIDGEKPVITLDSSVPKTAQTGDKITIKFTVTDNKTSQENIVVTVRVLFYGENLDLKDNSFTPDEEGSYYIIITATDESNNVAELKYEIKVTASPSKKGCGSVISSPTTIVAMSLSLLAIAGVSLLVLKKKKKNNN